MDKLFVKVFFDLLIKSEEFSALLFSQCQKVLILSNLFIYLFHVRISMSMFNSNGCISL